MQHTNRRHRKSYDLPGHAHELTFGCYHGYPFLSADRTCQWLAESLDASRRKLDFELWAYVFMPNHVHLIIRPGSDSLTVTSILSSVKLPVSRKSLAFLQEESPVWLKRVRTVRGGRSEYHFWQRGGGYDRNVTEPATLEQMIEYLHLNPVRRGLIERAADWKWSSAGWFEDLEPNSLRPDPIPPEWTVGMSAR